MEIVGKAAIFSPSKVQECVLPCLRLHNLTDCPTKVVIRTILHLPTEVVLIIDQS